MLEIIWSYILLDGHRQYNIFCTAYTSINTVHQV